MEIEAKLLVPDAAMAEQLRHRDSWAGYQLVAPRSQSVFDTYIDTRRGALRKAGYACRIRHVEGILVATLKSLGGAEEGIHRREELEQSIPSVCPPADWPDGHVKDAVLGFCGGEATRALCTIRQERFLRDVVDGERRIAVNSLDTVTVSLKDASRTWWEAEIELLPEGTENDLAAMRDWAVASVGLALSHGSKLDAALVFVALHRRRPVRSRADVETAELEAPTGVDEPSLLASLGAMGYTARRERSTAARLAFYDTREGAAARKNRTVRFREPARAWQICSGEFVVVSLGGDEPREAPPPELIEGFPAVSPGSRWSLLMRAELEETRFRVRRPGTLPLTAWLRRWTVHPPEGGEEHPPIFDLAVSGPRASADLEYLVSVLVTRTKCRTPSRPIVTRGLRQLGLPLPGESVPSHLALLPEDSPGVACGKILACEAWRLRKSLGGALRNSDPEFVHEMRVAARRARSATRILADILGVERAACLREELAWAGDLLGAARDLDVLALRCTEGFELMGASARFREALSHRLDGARGDAQRVLVDALRSERFAALLSDLETPPAPAAEGDGAMDLRVFAVKRIGRAIDRLSPWMQKRAADISDADLHALRILFKKARYACEFFMPVLGRELANLARAFVPYQDCLGRIQDAVAACEALTRFAEEWLVGGANGPELIGMGALIQVQRERLALDRALFDRLWESIASLESRWHKVKRVVPS